MKGTRFYRIWWGSKNRTCNPNNPDYPRYGGAGINYSESWKTFINFRDDMYETYVKHVEEYGENNTQIDRIDNTKGYSKDNCRWVTVRENLNNREGYAEVGTNGRPNWGKGILT
mgnify:FL=1